MTLCPECGSFQLSTSADGLTVTCLSCHETLELIELDERFALD